MKEKRETDMAVLAIVVDRKTGRIILIFDRSKPKPHWKFIVGGVKRKDFKRCPGDEESAADAAAIREVRGETGLVARIGHRLMRVTRHDGHRVHARVVVTEDMTNVVERGDSGEIPKAFSLEQIEGLIKNGAFLPHHLPFWKELLAYKSYLEVLFKER